jgi:hypothetical protein
MSTELSLAQSGGLDADLVAQHPFYGTDYTKPLLFLEDGSYFANQAQADHLTGTQWGVMNETGSYPGQPWLWLYQLWYQIPHFRTSSNVDLIAIYMTGVATILLLAIPFIPGLRDIPRLIPVHRLIWRSDNGDTGPSASGPGPIPSGGPVSAGGTPAVGTPAVGTPAVGTPAVGTPAVGTPIGVTNATPEVTPSEGGSGPP